MYIEKFRAYFGEIVQPHDKGTKIPCQWHEDKDPSLFLNYKTGQFVCYGCGKRGHIDDLTGKAPIIDDAVADRFHQHLLGEPKLMKWLKATKGWNAESINKLKIGFNGSRYTLPVRDERGNIVNIRLYSAVATPKILSFGEGYGAPTFFPHPPTEDSILLMEGESDTIMARQLGFAAYCQTGGADTWNERMTAALADKRVCVIYDVDRAGMRGAKKVVNSIKFTVKEVRNIFLPVTNGNKDFSDWILKDGGSADDLREIMAATPPYAVSRVHVEITDPAFLKLPDTALATWAFKPIETDVTVAGKDRAPYVVPRKFIVSCTPSQKYCPACKNNGSGHKEYELSWEDGKLIQLVDVNDLVKTQTLKAMCGIMVNCKGCEIEVTEFQNIEKLALFPQRTYRDVGDLAIDADTVLKKAYFIGSGIQTNAAYRLRGIPIPDARDQASVLLVVEADPLNTVEEITDTTLCEFFREEPKNEPNKGQVAEV